jgi:hypothetical protein
MPDDLGSYHVPDPDRRKQVTPVDFVNRLKETEARHKAQQAKAAQEAAAKQAHDSEVTAEAERHAQQEAAAAAEADRHAASQHHAPTNTKQPKGITKRFVLLVILGGLLLGLLLIAGYEQFFRKPAVQVVPRPLATPLASPSAPAGIQVVPNTPTTPAAASDAVPNRGIPPAQE